MDQRLNDRDHEQIFVAIKGMQETQTGLREDFKEVIEVVRNENNDRFKEIRDAQIQQTNMIHTLDKRLVKTETIASDSKSLIWKVGGAAIVAAMGALFKAMGWL